MCFACTIVNNLKNRGTLKWFKKNIYWSCWNINVAFWAGCRIKTKCFDFEYFFFYSVVQNCFSLTLGQGRLSDCNFLKVILIPCPCVFQPLVDNVFCWPTSSLCTVRKGKNLSVVQTHILKWKHSRYYYLTDCAYSSLCDLAHTRILYHSKAHF